MSCKIPSAVLEYLEEIESGKYKVCKEQIALCEYIRKVFANEDIYVEELETKFHNVKFLKAVTVLDNEISEPCEIYEIQNPVSVGKVLDGIVVMHIP